MCLTSSSTPNLREVLRTRDKEQLFLAFFFVDCTSAALFTELIQLQLVGVLATQITMRVIVVVFTYLALEAN